MQHFTTRLCIDKKQTLKRIYNNTDSNVYRLTRYVINDKEVEFIYDIRSNTHYYLYSDGGGCTSKLVEFNRGVLLKYDNIFVFIPNNSNIAVSDIDVILTILEQDKKAYKALCISLYPQTRHRDELTIYINNTKALILQGEDVVSYCDSSIWSLDSINIEMDNMPNDNILLQVQNLLPRSNVRVEDFEQVIDLYLHITDKLGYKLS